MIKGGVGRLFFGRERRYKYYMKMNRFTVLAGTIAPVLFVGVFTIDGLFHQNYQPARMTVSSLALGPGGWIQIANFMIFGLLLLVFARGLAALFGKEGISQVGSTLLQAIAIGYFLAGLFVTDPASTDPSQATVHGVVHGIVGATVFVLMPVSCFVWARLYLGDEHKRRFRDWTVVSGMIVLAAVILLAIAIKLPAAQQTFQGSVGLIQRMAIVMYMIWLFSLALGLYRHGKADE